MVLLRIRPKGSETVQNQTPWWQDAKFSFIRIPKELFQNPYYADLSPESKVLYGFLLDRASLSYASGEKWRTPQGDPFVIFTINEIRERLCCGKNKAIRLLQKLEEGKLIERSRPKKDGPYHIVIRPFLCGAPKANLPKLQNETDPVPRMKPAQVSEENPNNTEKNHTEINKTERITLLEERIKSQIDYVYFASQCPKNQVDTLVDVIAQTLLSPAKTITVAGVPMDGDVVRGYLERAESQRVEYIFDHMEAQEQPIRSYRSYFLARLCDPEGAVDAFYTEQHRLNDLDGIM